jgi:methylmalonyl-CoA/ethylmalonyl-CoA epimerase
MQFQVLHVGVAVPSLEPAIEFYRTLFGYHVASGPFEDPIQKVRVVFLALSSDDLAQIELIEPIAEDSPVQSMLRKGSGGAYHLCMQTADLDAAIKHAAANGCAVLSQPAPAVAFAGRRIAWIYTPARQLFELLEAKAAE